MKQFTTVPRDLFRSAIVQRVSCEGDHLQLWKLPNGAFSWFGERGPFLCAYPMRCSPRGFQFHEDKTLASQRLRAHLKVNGLRPAKVVSHACVASIRPMGFLPPRTSKVVNEKILREGEQLNYSLLCWQAVMSIGVMRLDVVMYDSDIYVLYRSLGAYETGMYIERRPPALWHDHYSLVTGWSQREAPDWAGLQARYEDAGFWFVEVRQIVQDSSVNLAPRALPTTRNK